MAERDQEMFRPLPIRQARARAGGVVYKSKPGGDHPFRLHLQHVPPTSILWPIKDVRQRYIMFYYLTGVLTIWQGVQFLRYFSLLLWYLPVNGFIGYYHERLSLAV